MVYRWSANEKFLSVRNSRPRKQSASKQAFADMGKGGYFMAKRTELKCPLCGAMQMRVKNCKEAELICHGCGASLLITKDEDGSCYVSARPQDYDQKVAAGQ